MIWKCDICDTYNDGGQPTCYVCGVPRSKASIRAEKRKAREEHFSRINQVIFEKSFNIFRILFMIGCLTSLAAVVIMVIVKLIQGDIGSAAINLADVLKHLGDNLVTALITNGRDILRSLLTPPLLDVGRNIGSVFANWGETLSELSAVFEKMFIHTAKNNIEHDFMGSASFLKSSAAGNLSGLYCVVAAVAANALHHVSDGAKIISKVLQSIQQFFI